jgi:hypothetical protein
VSGNNVYTVNSQPVANEVGNSMEGTEVSSLFVVEYYLITASDAKYFGDISNQRD